MPKPTPFALYCSNKANTLLTIYKHPLNKAKICPALVLYDGDDKATLAQLKNLFGTKVVVFDPSLFGEAMQRKTHTMVSLFIEAQMAKHGLSHLICFGQKILKKNLLDAFPKGIINFHPALLPAFKGVNAIDQALATGTSFLGLTAHYVDEGIDTGQIVAQAAMYRHDFEDYPDALELTGPLLKLVLKGWLGIALSREEIIAELSERTKPYFLPEQGRF